jgi:tol-pal system protein YbgF
MMQQYLLTSLCIPALLLLVLPFQAFAETQAGDITQRLDRIERLLEGQALLDMHDQLQRLQSEVQHLRGEIESQQRLVDNLNQRLEDVEARPVPETVAVAEDGMPPADPDAVDDEMLSVDMAVDADDETVAMLPPLAHEPDGDAVDGEEPETVTEFDPDAARAAYNQAFDLLKDAKYDQAIAALQDYLHNYPSGDDAGNAQYWLGEAYYVTRDYEQAIEAYKRLTERHPGNSQVPQARLKIGYSQHELGDIAAARSTLQNVRQTYAGTTVARLAEDRLQKLAGAD